MTLLTLIGPILITDVAKKLELFRRAEEQRLELGFVQAAPV